MQTLSTGIGLALLVLFAGDLFLTALHPDRDGPMTRRLQLGVWFTVTALGRVAKRHRRQLLALGGPVALVLTYAAWLTVFFLAFAFLYLPHLGGSFGVAEEAAPVATLLDAVYVSVGTAAVLGLGDVVPTTSAMRLLVVSQAAVGFASISATITYLLQTLRGFEQRTRLAQRLHEQTDGGRGIEVVRRYLEVDDVAGLRRELDTIVRDLRELQADLYLFPMVDLYYRTIGPELDPEPMLVRLGDIGVACHLLGTRAELAPLRNPARDLDRSLSRFFRAVASQYSRERRARTVTDPSPDEEDAELVEELRQELDQILEAEHRPPEEVLADARLLRARTVAFLELFSHRSA